MALTKTDFDNLDVRIENIVSQSVEQIREYEKISVNKILL